MTAAIAPILSRFWCDRRGVVALEMAVILPLLCLMILGFFEAYMYMRTVAQIERTSSTLASIMARQQQPLVDCAATDNSLNLGVYVDAAQKMMRPASLSTQGEVFLSAVNIPAQTPVVAWQRRSTFTVAGASSVLGRQGSNANLPQGLAPAGSGAIVLVAEVVYRFRPFAMTASFWPDAPGTVTIHRTAYFRARTFNLDNLTNNGCTGAALPQP